MTIGIITLSITVIILVSLLISLRHKLYIKQELDIKAREELEEKIKQLELTKQEIEKQLINKQHEIALELQQAIANKDQQISSYYLLKINEIEKELGLLREDQRAELEQTLAAERVKLEQHKQTINKQINDATKSRDELLVAADEQIKDAQAKVAAIIAVMREAEEKEQKELFYTLQITQEAKEDIILIEQLLKQLNNKDIVRKLIWASYFQPAFQSLTKRIGLNDSISGIYKITNLKDGKNYIGKSTSVRSRWSDHIKAALGISTISSQHVHSMMKENGLWNFTFTLVEECPKEKLSEREKFYIQFFQSDEFGYNKTV